MRGFTYASKKKTAPRKFGWSRRERRTRFYRGFTKESLLPGTLITVDGYQSKDRTKRANGRDLTFADGKKLFLGSSGTGAPRDGKDPNEPKKDDPQKKKQ